MYRVGRGKKFLPPSKKIDVYMRISCIGFLEINWYFIFKRIRIENYTLDLLARDHWDPYGFKRVSPRRPEEKPTHHTQGGKAAEAAMSPTDLAFKRRVLTETAIIFASHAFITPGLCSPPECPPHPLCLHTRYLSFKVRMESHFPGVSSLCTAHCNDL